MQLQNSYKNKKETTLIQAFCITSLFAQQRKFYIKTLDAIYEIS